MHTLRKDKLFEGVLPEVQEQAITANGASASCTGVHGAHCAMETRMGQIQRAFLGIKKSGVHRDILVAYLHDRCNTGKTDIVKMLEAQDEFYQKLVKLSE